MAAVRAIPLSRGMSAPVCSWIVRSGPGRDPRRAAHREEGGGHEEHAEDGDLSAEDEAEDEDGRFRPREREDAEEDAERARQVQPGPAMDLLARDEGENDPPDA